MSRANSILGDKFYNQNCYEYIALRSGFANANFVGESANPLYNGIKPAKLQRTAPIPVSLDVLAINQAKLYGGNKHNTARQIIEQYVAEEKAYKNPIVRLETQPQVVVEQASNIAIPTRSYGNRGERILTQSISRDALDNSEILDNYQKALIKLSTESKNQLAKSINEIATQNNIDLDNYSSQPQLQTIRGLEALLAVGVDMTPINNILLPVRVKGRLIGLLKDIKDPVKGTLIKQEIMVPKSVAQDVKDYAKKVSQEEQEEEINMY